jgi:hypothetical protein
MEDYILREIDRIGEMLMKIARKMGLFLDDVPDYPLTEVKEEFEKEGCPVSLDVLLEQKYPVKYLVEDIKLSDQSLELLIELFFHSSLEESRKQALLADALTYFDGKGYYSFKLHALEGEKS